MKPVGSSGLIWSLARSRRRSIFVLTAWTFAAAGFELSLIANAFSFLTLLSGAGAPPPYLPTSRIVAILQERTGLTTISSQGALLIASSIGAAVTRLKIIRMTQAVGEGLGHDLASRIVGFALFRDWADYHNRNSSEILSLLQKVDTLVAGLFLPILTAVAATALGAFILGALIIASPVPALFGFSIIAAIYYLIARCSKNGLGEISKSIAAEATERMKIINEILGGYKDIKMIGREWQYKENFDRVDTQIRRKFADLQIVAQVPKQVIDVAGVATLTVMAIFSSSLSGGGQDIIPLLGGIALAGQRLLPVLQQIFAGWSFYRGHSGALEDLGRMTDLAAALTMEAPSDNDINNRFRGKWSRIEFKNVSFSYGGPALISDLSLTIERGQLVVVKGPSGAGKSTLLALISGVLEPSQGSLSVDGEKINAANWRAWRNLIAFVHQDVYLADVSILENIAFGVPRSAIDHERAMAVARACQVDAIASLFDRGFDTEVGDRGARLSGGQRQKIALARALYRGAEILLLDEVTSALDAQAEEMLNHMLSALESRVTVIAVSHKPKILEVADMLIEMPDGKIIDLSHGQIRH